ncbi:MAG: sigma-54 dependent transcriptional regulator [Acidobacteriota bacterium]|nr:sigma-54 dependent transcriptional regulator [Acidobacteriota bacterium]
MSRLCGIDPLAKPRILVVDDDTAIRDLLNLMLTEEGYEVRTAASGLRAEEIILRGYYPDLVLLDSLMPEQDGPTTLRNLQHSYPGLKVVMLSGVTGTRQVVEAVKLGAYDYLAKPCHPSELLELVAGCLRRAPAAAGPAPLEITEELDEGVFLAASRALRELHEQALRIARTDLPVLILGESGTGKEAIARLIHKHSQRAERSFLKLNCAALPAELVESELFGYEQGAFTGANHNKRGKFEFVDHGTMLLDEIGELPSVLQAKLLQVLQDGTFERLGGRKTIKVDVRLIAATNVDMPRALANGTFREDLYYRLNACVLQVPPLRERPEDIPLLLRHYLAEYARLYNCTAPPISQALVEGCCRFPWPGNVRELCSFLKRLLMVRDESAMLRDLEDLTLHLPRRLQPGAGAVAARMDWNGG